MPFATLGISRFPIAAMDKPWSAQVGLGLTLWEGTFENTEGTWLQWCDDTGVILPTSAERAAQAEAKAAKLAERLRALGVDPDKLD